MTLLLNTHAGHFFKRVLLHTFPAPLLLDNFAWHSYETLLLDTSGTPRNTTLYYKAFAKYFPMIVYTTKLLQITSQYYSKISKACTKQLPVLFCTTKLAQGTSQYYFALQTPHFTLTLMSQRTSLESLKKRLSHPNLTGIDLKSW